MIKKILLWLQGAEGDKLTFGNVTRYLFDPSSPTMTISLRWMISISTMILKCSPVAVPMVESISMTCSIINIFDPISITNPSHRYLQMKKIKLGKTHLLSTLWINLLFRAITTSNKYKRLKTLTIWASPYDHFSHPTNMQIEFRRNFGSNCFVMN